MKPKGGVVYFFVFDVVCVIIKRERYIFYDIRVVIPTGIKISL